MNNQDIKNYLSAIGAKGGAAKTEAKTRAARENSRLPRLSWAKVKADRRVRNAYAEQDDGEKPTYWIDLAEGYVLMPDGTTSIHETSKRAAIHALRRVKKGEGL